MSKSFRLFLLYWLGALLGTMAAFGVILNGRGFTGVAPILILFSFPSFGAILFTVLGNVNE